MGMGKGGYSGGSSLVGPNGWVLGSREASIGRDKPVVMPHVEKPKEVFVHPMKRKRPPKPASGPLTDEQARTLELGFLEAVIHAHLRGFPMPGIPKALRAALEETIDGAGGVVAWARNHCEAAAVI